MATATPVHGSRAVFKIATVDLSDHLQGEIGVKGVHETVDTVVFGATAETHTVSPIRKNEDIDFEMLFDAATHTTLSPLIGASSTGDYFPIGTTAGLPRQTGTVTLTSYAVGSNIGGVTMIKGTIRPNGAWPWSTAP